MADGLVDDLPDPAGILRHRFEHAHGYLTSSFHTRDAGRQCTLSRTTADAASPEGDDLVAEIFSSVLD